MCVSLLFIIIISCMTLYEHSNIVENFHVKTLKNLTLYYIFRIYYLFNDFPNSL